MHISKLSGKSHNNGCFCSNSRGWVFNRCAGAYSVCLLQLTNDMVSSHLVQNEVFQWRILTDPKLTSKVFLYCVLIVTTIWCHHGTLLCLTGWCDIQHLSLTIFSTSFAQVTIPHANHYLFTRPTYEPIATSVPWLTGLSCLFLRLLRVATFSVAYQHHVC